METTSRCWFLQLQNGACVQAGSSLLEEGSWSQDRRGWQEGRGWVSGTDLPRSHSLPVAGPKWVPVEPLEGPEAGAAPMPPPQPSLLGGGARTQGRRGMQVCGVLCVSLTASILLSFPGFISACSCLSLGFWWWKSSSLCEANDLPLCEAYWRLDPDTDSTDCLSAPLLASPEPSAGGPLQAAAPTHSHAGGPGPTEHA